MIKTMPENERPREKMSKNGPTALSNAELLAIIIRTGTKDKSALDLANAVIKLCESDIGELRDISLNMLTSVDGIGPSKACQIMAGIELGLRLQNSKPTMGNKITSPNDVVDVFQNTLKHYKVEHFIAVFLSTKNTIIGSETISVGSLNASIVHPREVFNRAIKKHAASIVVLHNHPSGDTTPSREDLNITTRLCEAGKILGIEVLDHIIIGFQGYYSFKENHQI